MKTYYVYILANKKKGTLYIGLTNELERRILEHKEGGTKSFSSQYETTLLVYYEEHGTYSEAFGRERNLKAWKRWWKKELIEKDNLDWEDLARAW